MRQSSQAAKQCPLCGRDQVPHDATFCPFCEQRLPAVRPALDFSAHIAERTSEFTGRAWVFREIGAWLADVEAPRIFLITGEPGCGKTAVAARLVQFSAGAVKPPQDLRHLGPGFLDAHHFCAADRRRWISPHVFSESLAQQLARYPEYADALVALKDRGSDQQRPPYQVLHQRMERISDQGLVIGYLNIIERFVITSAPPEDGFVTAILEPLTALARRREELQIVILVDALDEALLYSGKVGIVSLLTQASSMPSGVRFILTTRPDPTLLRMIRRLGVKEVSLTEGEGLGHSLGDVEHHLHGVLNRRPELVDKLAPQYPRSAFERDVQAKSGGNFLYVRYLLDMLAEQRTPIRPESLEALPDELDGIYLEFLDRLTRCDLNVWAGSYEPVLGTLSVAQEGLREAQLADFVGRTKSHVRRTLTTLHQFLDVDPFLPATKRLYRIYHRSFADLLLDPDRSEQYWCEEEVQHQRIASHLKTFEGRWTKCDSYSLEHAAHHLIRAGQTEDLDRMFNVKFVEASRRRFGWHLPFVRNLQQAVEVMEPERATQLCLNIIYGKGPNSYVNQRILYLLKNQIRPALQKEGKPVGDPGSRRDRAIDQAVAKLSLPPSSAVPDLIEMFQNTRGRLRGFVALALGATKSPLARERLLRAMQEEKETIGWSVADALLDLNDRSIIPHLIDWFSSARSSGLRRRILYVLGRMQATEARGLIDEGLKDDQWVVKSHAINMLWLLAPVEGAEKMLWEKLSFSEKGPEYDTKPVWTSEHLQHRLVRVLGRIGSRQSIDHLTHFAAEDVARRDQPTTEGARRRRERLEETLDRAIRELERRHTLPVPQLRATQDQE